MAWRGRSPNSFRAIGSQPVLVENKPGPARWSGANSSPGPPLDGYTLFFTTYSSITSNPHLYKNMPFDPIKELAPATQLIDLHQMVVVHPSVPANTMQELVAWRRGSRHAELRLLRQRHPAAPAVRVAERATGIK